MIGISGPPPRATPLARAALAAALVLHLLFLANLAGAFRGVLRDRAPFGIDRLFNDPTHTLGLGADFFQFYQSGYDARQGWSIYQARTPEAPRGLVVPYQYGNHYPPFVAYAIGVPLSFLRPWTAYWTWVALQVAVTWFIALWSYQLADRPSVGCAAAAMWLAYTPWYVDAYMGQINILMAAGLFGLVLAYERDRPWRGATVYTVLTVIKLFPLLFAPVFARFREWRTLLLCAAGLVLTFVPYFAFRPDDWRFFLNWAGATDVSPLAITSGNLGLKVLLFHLTHSQAFVRMVGYAFVGVSLMVTFVSPSRDLRLYIGLWVCTFFFIQTFVWEHHYMILVPVLVLLYLREPRPVFLVFFAWLAVPTLFVFFDVPELGRRVYPEPRWAQWQILAYHTWKLIPVFGLYGLIMGALLPRPEHTVHHLPDSAVS